MFGSKKKGAEAKPAPAPAPQPQAPVEAAKKMSEAKNYISSGTVIEGNIVSHEDLHMDGTVKGDIKTSARLVLGKDSVVEGNILASEAEVAGRITGTVESKGLLAIKSTCVIDGDIVTKSLNVESGSSFNGRCKVGDAAEADRSGNRLRAGAAQKPAAPAAPAAPGAGK
ncbi:MAG: polymer-forming cytoskeletal protein [Planctomycetaceae bacterium]|nr:polymer-forming cytoskeletal protein [Planctomycetaceae bacterium]